MRAVLAHSPLERGKRLFEASNQQIVGSCLTGARRLSSHLICGRDSAATPILSALVATATIDFFDVRVFRRDTPGPPPISSMNSTPAPLRARRIESNRI
jgi:hypothetical protein